MTAKHPRHQAVTDAAGMRRGFLSTSELRDPI